MLKKIKAFTFVELIVVITILAILWTIAFISLEEERRPSDNKYRVKYDWYTHYIKSYETDWDCISFKEKEKRVKICWSYYIKEI